MSNIESTLTVRAKYCCLQSLAEGNVAKYLLRVELSSKTFTMRVQQNIYIESLFSQAQIKLNLNIDCRHSAHSRFTKLIHHLSSDQSGQGAARHGMQHNIAHIIILPLLHQHDMKIIQLRSAGDFSCALRELRLLLLVHHLQLGHAVILRANVVHLELNARPDIAV